MNHIQRFVAANATTESGVFRVHRAGYVSADFVLTPNMTSAALELAIEGTDPITACGASAGITNGSGQSDVTFTNPSHEQLFFEKIAGTNWSTIQITAGQTLEAQLGKPTIDQITYNTARLTPPPGGAPTGVSQVNLQIRSKEPGTLDSTYSAWGNVINSVVFTGPTTFPNPEKKIIEARFEVIAA